MANQEVWSAYSILFDIHISEENLKVRYLRSILASAGPIQEGDRRYESIDDNKMEQDEVATRFQLTLREISESGESRYSNIRARIFAPLIYGVHFNEVVAGDVTWAVFSGLFVFFFIWFHLESLFMAVISMISILMSFPVSYAIYFGVL